MQSKCKRDYLTTCIRCQEFKYVVYDDLRKAWFCFDCTKEIKIQEQSWERQNFNPSKRNVL